MPHPKSHGNQCFIVSRYISLLLTSQTTVLLVLASEPMRSVFMRNREVVVVTGASAGVGRAAACEFAKHGAAVALLARGRDGLEGARRDVERLGGKALVVPCDVADSETVEAAAAKVERQLGP